MTHAEKLQQIFEAALKDTSEITKPLTRVFPASPGAMPVAASQPAPETEPEPARIAEAPVARSVNAGRSDPAAVDLGALIEEQLPRKIRGHRRARITLGVLTILTGITFCWFVNSPQRVVAFNEATHDIRSVGDVGATVAKYQVALDKIAARSK